MAPAGVSSWLIAHIPAALSWLRGTCGSSPGTQPAEGKVDFTTTPQVVWISLLAVCLGLSGALIAIGLRDFIGLMTNAVYYQHFSIQDVSPRANHLGWLAVSIPVAGSLIAGLLARSGAEEIRSSGVPATTEAILIHGSRIPPSLLRLKPLATAVSIGTGAPFGIEGPIMLTGGSAGSLVGQLLGLTAAERRTLLVAGAVGGFTTIFNVPVTAILLALELLLFELWPRSLLPIALAAGAATLLRWAMIGLAPMFPLRAHPALGIEGVLAWLLTPGAYAAEDTLRRISIPRCGGRQSAASLHPVRWTPATIPFRPS